MKIVAIVQARMGSTRLPGKTLKLIQEKPILQILVERLMKATRLDKIIIATTNNPLDKQIVTFCKHNKLNFFCGSEDDVLDRYYKCAKLNSAKNIVRVTSDCPLIDPLVVDKTIDLYFKTV